jgi:23S rRNA (cytosine1962-C5)-methyltransferase
MKPPPDGGIVEGTVRLKDKKDRPVRRGHPWIFAGAIERASNSAPGDLVNVTTSKGEPLGRGAFSPSSQIRVRMLSSANAPLDAAILIRGRIEEAVALRKKLVLRNDTTCARLVFAESDGLPGLIVDAYGDTLVMQCQSAFADRYRDAVAAALTLELSPARILERSDAEVRRLEGLEPRVQWMKGQAVEGGLVRAQENGMTFLVDVEKGHKTGFYLDQRDSRAKVRSVADGRKVLNCFSYTGGFAIAALSGGAAHALSVDTSQGALDLGKKNAEANGFAQERHDWQKGDVFDVLRDLQKEGRMFDLVVLDPPKFAPSAHHLEKAVRGYKDLAIRGLKVLNPGGLLFTFSCSGAVDRGLFAEILRDASIDAGRPIRVLGSLGHPPDHPVLATFPEGEYLKGLWGSV